MRTIESPAAGVWVTTSRRDATTTTVLVDGGEALLVDPAWDPDELAELADSLDAAGLRVAGGFATHAHHDHLLWHQRFGDAPRWASAETARRAAAGRAELVTALGRDWPAALARLVGRVTGVDRIEWPGAEMIEHDAHAPGHTALWLPAQRVLIAGDMLSDVEIPLLEDSGWADYRAGLDRLRPYAEAAATVIPGHGTVGRDAAARWLADSRYLDGLADGAPADDPRLRSPAMAAAHAANLTTGDSANFDDRLDLDG